MKFAMPVKRRTARAGLIGAAALALAVGSATAAAAQPRAPSPASPHGASSFRLSGNMRQVCAAPARPGEARCLSLIRTDVRPLLSAAPDLTPAGYGPPSLQSAYKLPSSSAGAGQTVAIVDAYDDPNAAADLAAYRSQYGLPACTSSSGCFTKVNQNGAASPLPPASGSTGWATEESLDIDMVSAICPNCRILLVEANSPTIVNLGTSVNSAVSLGAKYVSNSYGGGEYSGETTDDSSYYNHPGVAVTASAGDSGYGVEFPAASQHVVAVGGTSLAAASNSRGWTETAWSGTGSGCSAAEPKPSFQTDSGCPRRTNNDVSAVADPNTGVAVYDSYDQGGWLVVGGTSASSPIIASTYALAGTPAAGSYPASYPYAHTTSLFDVTSGSDGSCSPAYLCTAGPGYDGPTGLGTPNGTAAFSAGGGGGGGFEAAFQANTTSLWTAGSAGGGSLGLGMAAGTSPSITALTTGGYEIAFQANTTDLWTTGSAGGGDLHLGMMPGTSPSITALPGGGYEIAFQANTTSLWTTGTAGTTNWQLGMAAGTSPSITGLPGGGFEVAFQANTTSLWTAGAAGTGSLGLGMAANTSPSITALTTGGYQIAFQANTTSLWTTGTAGTTNWQLGMLTGTSPGITGLH